MYVKCYVSEVSLKSFLLNHAAIVTIPSPSSPEGRTLDAAVKREALQGNKVLSTPSAVLVHLSKYL